MNNLLCYIYSQCQATNQCDVQGIEVEEVVEIRRCNGEETRPTVQVLSLEFTHDCRIIIVHGMGDVLVVESLGIHSCSDQIQLLQHWLAHLKLGVSRSPYILCRFLGCRLTL